MQLLTQPPAHTAASRPSPASSSSQPSSSKHTYFTEEVSDLKDPSSIKHLKAPSSKSKGKAKMHAADAEHRDSIVQELRARLERDAALARVERDVQVQKNLMGKGVAKQLVGRRSTQEEDDDEFNDDDAMGRGDQQAKQRSKLLPKPQQGIRTGARVYKFKMERQR